MYMGKRMDKTLINSTWNEPSSRQRQIWMEGKKILFYAEAELYPANGTKLPTQGNLFASVYVNGSLSLIFACGTCLGASVV